MSRVNDRMDLSKGDRSRSALDVVHQWLAKPTAGQESWQEMLQELAHAFDASAATIAGVTASALLVLYRSEQTDTDVTDLAWLCREKNDLLEQIAEASSVVVASPAGEQW